MTTITTVVISARLNLDIKNCHGLAVTMVTIMITCYGWVVIVIIVIVATPKQERGFFTSRNFHGQAMIIVTIVTISVEGNINIHGLVMILFTAIIWHHGQVVIFFTVMMLSVGFLVSKRKLHGLAMTVVMVKIV